MINQVHFYTKRIILLQMADSSHCRKSVHWTEYEPGTVHSITPRLVNLELMASRC